MSSARLTRPLAKSEKGTAQHEQRALVASLCCRRRSSPSEGRQLLALSGPKPATLTTLQRLPHSIPPHLGLGQGRETHVPCQYLALELSKDLIRDTPLARLGQKACGLGD